MPEPPHVELRINPINNSLREEEEDCQGMMGTGAEREEMKEESMEVPCRALHRLASAAVARR